MKAAIVSVSMGVMEPLLSKLSKLLDEEYDKLRGVSKQIKFLRDELSAISPALQMLADADELNPQMKHWRDQVRELAYDIEDCIDAFMARADREDGGPTGIWGLFHQFNKMIARHEIANEIEELKARAIEVSERNKRYNFVELASNSSRTSALDPRLPALYEEIDRLVGIGDEWIISKT
uniref:Disease resistance N-terminal domain-containing protein n=1 Tax=Arundo donax TaxID=35708 RepID=A0A0A9F202_ARUDO